MGRKKHSGGEKPPARDAKAGSRDSEASGKKWRQRAMNSYSSSKYIKERYDSAIDYYWKASRHNKWAYKNTRIFTVILGALVTLVAALSSASFIESSPSLNITFAILTPVLAAALTIIGGLSQSFQWGAAWRDMVLNAQRLEKERDRLNITKPDEQDPASEVSILNDLVIDETQTFFQRILGGGRKEEDNVGKTG